MAARSAAPTAPTALAALGQAVTRHYELQELAESIHAAPRPLDLVKADAAHVVARLAGEWDFGHIIDYLPRPDGWLAAARHLLAPATHNNLSAAPTTVLAKVAPELFKRLLVEELERRYETLPPPIADDERKAQLAKLASEHAANQVTMSTAWWALDDGGEPPAPPAELEAAALLGLEPENAS